MITQMKGSDEDIAQLGHRERHTSDDEADVAAMLAYMIERVASRCLA